MTEDNQGTPLSSSTSKKSRGSVDTYAAQCHECLKWRVMATEEEYEEIRSKTGSEKFTCKAKDLSCDTPADIEYNASRTWVIDKPGVPRTPRGFRRYLVLRRDFSKMDAYYITPTGKKLRTRNEIAAFVQANPQYKDIKIDDFNFTSPKVMEDTVPEDAKKKAAANGNSNKKSKISKDEA
ncbi:Methyl-CpG-binding domain-containing protein 4 [Linum grandiflorum]